MLDSKEQLFPTQKWNKLDWVKNNHNNINDCRHKNCSQCHGTGIKKDGQQCIHMISCSCKKCNPYHL